MIEKIKKYQNHPLLHQLRDVRFLGFIVFGILVLLASWSGVKVIDTNFVLQKQIAQLDQRNQLQELINTNLKLQNEYYNTDTYLELTARKQLGKGAPGEKLLLVPKSVALAHAKELPSSDADAPFVEADDRKPAYRKNIDAWLGFLFHKS